MVNMDINASTPFTYVLEQYPQIFPLFQRIGVCCVHEGNKNCTVGEVCAQCGVDAESFLETVQASI